MTKKQFKTICDDIWIKFPIKANSQTKMANSHDANHPLMKGRIIEIDKEKKQVLFSFVDKTIEWIPFEKVNLTQIIL